MKINIIYFWFMNNWGKFGFEYEFIVKYFAKQEIVRNLICVFPPESSKFYQPFSCVNESNKLHLITPNSSVLPLSRFRFMKQTGNFISKVALKHYIKMLGCKGNDTVLWVVPPHEYIGDLMQFVPHSFLITQIVDNNAYLESLSQNEINFIRKQYDDLSKNADMVTTASKFNYDIFSRINPNCYVFENAVDEAFIGKPSKLPCLTNGTRPRIGYLGFITERTDIQLLDYIARSRPRYGLLIAGPQDGEVLNKYGTLDLPNVSYEGVIPYREVPKFIESLDVCLIPHKDTPYSRSMNPLKIYQYLASGRPIVSTDIAGVERWKESISVAADHHDFVTKIDKTLKNDSRELSAKRIEEAKKEIWDVRLKDLFETVTNNYLHAQQRRERDYKEKHVT
jgi:glycosyltransferase involved in cell wall biosynthesis